MTPEEIRKMAIAGESETLELKKTTGERNEAAFRSGGTGALLIVHRLGRGDTCTVVPTTTRRHVVRDKIGDIPLAGTSSDLPTPMLPTAACSPNGEIGQALSKARARRTLHGYTTPSASSDRRRHPIGGGTLRIPAPGSLRNPILNALKNIRNDRHAWYCTASPALGAQPKTTG